jgi:hypothetical protein
MADSSAIANWISAASSSVAAGATVWSASQKASRLGPTPRRLVRARRPVVSEWAAFNTCPYLHAEGMG